MQLYDRYQKPLFVAENGMGAMDRIAEDGKIPFGGRAVAHDKAGDAAE